MLLIELLDERASIILLDLSLRFLKFRLTKEFVYLIAFAIYGAELGDNLKFDKSTLESYNN
jgi:hypothetical protein